MLFNIIIFVFFLVMIKLVIATDIGNEEHRSSLIITTDDSMLVGQSIHKSKAADIFDCALCLVGDQCKSFNFNRATGDCYSNRRRAEAKELVQADGFIYGEKINPCYSTPCSGGSCRPDENYSTAECICFIDDPCYKGCNTPLGMQSEAIPNSAITASSYYDRGHEPFRARLHLKGSVDFYVNAGAWSSKYLKAGEYLQVDLGQVRWVSAVETQGRSNQEQWVTSYFLGYSLDEVNYKLYTEFLKDEVKVFQGNSDRNTVVKHVLQKRAIQARFIRFVVQTWHKHISMRAEIYGCSL